MYHVINNTKQLQVNNPSNNVLNTLLQTVCYWGPVLAHSSYYWDGKHSTFWAISNSISIMNTPIYAYTHTLSCVVWLMVSGHPGCHGNPYSMAATLKFITVTVVFVVGAPGSVMVFLLSTNHAWTLICHDCAKEKYLDVIPWQHSAWIMFTLCLAVFGVCDTC